MKRAVWFLLILLATTSCKKKEENKIIPTELDYREEMRKFVIGISYYAKSFNPDFIVIPQNGIELVTYNNNDMETKHENYLNAIDGNGQEDLFYGYINDDEATPNDENVYLRSYLDISKNAGKIILVTDYCSTPVNMDDSYSKNNAAGYISFAAYNRELNSIPYYPNPIYNNNFATITDLTQVQNFLYLINPENYNSRSDFIIAITSTNYDLLIMDLFFNDGSEFPEFEINQMKNKANGGRRLVIAYMSIGEAEDYRYYWQNDWETNQPNWMDIENPDWTGNFKVKYWIKEWQQIIYGNDDSYLKKIIDANFDGVYLDIIDAFEYYE